MNAAFRQNLSVVFMFDGNNSGIARDARGSLGDVTDRARFCRTTATLILGVSDPHGSRPGTGFGGWQRGSLTPQMPPPLLLTAAHTSTRAAQSAARYSAAKSHTAKNIAESTRLALTLTRPRAWKRTGRQGGGTLLPSLCSPLFQDIHTQVAYTGWSGVHRSPHLYSDGRDYLEDDEYRALQLFVAGDPEAGDVMPCTGGFRKLRWADRRRGKGKRGGLRVIYHYLSADAQIWLMTLYDKDEMADLSAAEKRALKAALEAELARRAARRRLRRK
jgi:hypothetical protein